jgi:cytochrome c oxidase assembly protein subunit 15
MVDPVGFREPWHLLRVPERALAELGFLIEHSHRLAGFVVGTCVVVLAIGLWLCESRRWLRWLGLAALVGVSAQGVLGIFRVNLNAWMGKDLALIHGCFAQLVFALLVSLALFTSRSWTEALPTSATTAEMKRLRHWSLLTAALIYLQLVLGGSVRHTYSALGQRGHFLVAFAVVASVVWLMRIVYEHHAANKPLLATVKLLAALVAFQIVLGVEAWMMKFSSGGLPELQASTAGQGFIRTAHFVVGSGIFATAVVATLRAHRHLALALPLAPASLGQMEGAA